MMKRVVILILSCLVQLTLQAQGKAVFADTDQKVYVTGERIWISGKLTGSPDPNERELSIFFFSRNSRMIYKDHVKTEQGKFHTQIKLKGDLPTDNYVVAIAEGGKFRLFIPVSVINPVIAPEKSEDIAVAAMSPESFQPLNLSVNSSSFNRRSEVLVKVDTPAARLDYFISVARKDELSAYADSMFSGWKFNSDIPVSDHS